MKSAASFVVILVTAPNLTSARKLARAALDQKLVACVNIVPHMESHYWWEGNLESSKEVLLMLKSRKALFQKLESLIQKIHPYKTPEIIALPLAEGSSRYLDWLRLETGEARS